MSIGRWLAGYCRATPLRSAGCSTASSRACIALRSRVSTVMRTQQARLCSARSARRSNVSTLSGRSGAVHLVLPGLSQYRHRLSPGAFGESSRRSYRSRISPTCARSSRALRRRRPISRTCRRGSRTCAGWCKRPSIGYPDRYSDVLEWKYVDGLSVDEIAAQLNISVKAAESLLTRARGAFRQAITALAGTSDALYPLQNYEQG